MSTKTQIVCQSAKNDDATSLQTLLFSNPEMLTAPICRSTHTALTLSAMHGAHSVIAMLLSHKTPPDLRASRAKLPTALCIACTSADALAVDMLIRAGARVRWSGVDQQEPLHYALQAWQSGVGDARRVVELLVQAGALDESKEMGGAFADGNIYPAHFAMQKGVADAISVMLDANESSKGAILAAMQVRGLGASACSEGNAQVLVTLIKAGYDVSLTDTYSQTLLHHAMKAPPAQIESLVQILFRTKLDLLAQDAFGRTALQIAKQRNLAPVVSLLRGVGAEDKSFTSLVLQNHGNDLYAQEGSHVNMDQLCSTGQLQMHTTKGRRLTLFGSNSSLKLQSRSARRLNQLRRALRSKKRVVDT